jgi:hypothetical protein
MSRAIRAEHCKRIVAFARGRDNLPSTLSLVISSLQRGGPILRAARDGSSYEADIAAD